jgi:hypothetical protein
MWNRTRGRAAGGRSRRKEGMNRRGTRLASELFYRARNGIMAVAVTLRPGFSAAKPKVLFEGGCRPI